MKRILGLFLTLATLCGLLGEPLFAQVRQSNGYTYWENPRDGSLEIRSVRTEVAGELHVPETIDGKKVKNIQSHAFIGCPNVLCIVLPGTLERIEGRTFSGCQKLEEVRVPRSVKAIEPMAFPAEVEVVLARNHPHFTIVGGALYDKTKTRLLRAPGKFPHVRVPNGVTTIDHGVFSNNSIIKTIRLPATLKQLGSLINCSNLERVNMPANAQLTGFVSGCPKACFYVDARSKYHRSRNGILLDREQSVLYHVPDNFETLAIPQGVKMIHSYAFSECSRLTAVAIPQSIEYLGENAFEKCKQLKAIQIPSAVKNVGRGIFAGCEALEVVKINAPLTSLPSYIFEGCKALASVTLPKTIQTIGFGSFRGCETLQRVELPDALTEVVAYSFAECKALQELTFPESVKKIEYWVFGDCKELKKITFRGKPPRVLTNSFMRIPKTCSLVYPAKYATEWRAVKGDPEWKMYSLVEE